MVGPARKQRRPRRCKLSGTKFKSHDDIKAQERDYVSNIVPCIGTRKKPLLLKGNLSIKEESKTKKTDERIFGTEED
jgi:hypothetical protein